MAEQKLVSGIVRARNSFFASDGNLYRPGEVCNFCPASDVGEDKKFAPVPTGRGDDERDVPKAEEKPIPTTTFDATKFVNRNADDVADAIREVDPYYLDVIERAEVAGKNRSTVIDAVKARRDK